ncbi:hypothetical protein AGR7A_Cc120075 [Agrobacterium deltaense NCPPB 1641]|uniref:Uncharacterized protein n=1 Tax=Agrobacterium deltaense NCPPB 1641 TaxID=1183425 RepID=A0A1S7TJ46_9HYPH|nr:hypothetical protein AGR7A_Cc120075 [Agrobacterium deltaense NCPPB 1641]
MDYSQWNWLIMPFSKQWVNTLVTSKEDLIGYLIQT